MTTRLALSVLLAFTAAQAAPPPPWAGKIRADHPRLFLNADTWSGVKARALGEEQVWYAGIRRRVDDILAKPRPEAPRDRGVDAACAAFVYLVEGDPRYLADAKAALAEALDHYEARLHEKGTTEFSVG